MNSKFSKRFRAEINSRTNCKRSFLRYRKKRNNFVQVAVLIKSVPQLATAGVKILHVRWFEVLDEQIFLNVRMVLPSQRVAFTIFFSL